MRSPTLRRLRHFRLHYYFWPRIAYSECWGLSPLWRNNTPLLETAILRHYENLSWPLGPLEHKRISFSKKMDEMLQVAVERRGNGTGSGEMSLYVQPSSIPARFKQRVQRMEILRKRSSGISERREE